MKSEIIAAILTGGLAGLVSGFVAKTQSDCVTKVADKAMKNGYSFNITQNAKEQTVSISANPTGYTLMYNGTPITLSKEFMDKLTDMYIRWLYQFYIQQPVYQQIPQPVA